MKKESVVTALRTAVLRVYRRLVRLYPSDFRRRYGAGMERMFREEMEEACRRNPIPSVILLILREALDILRTAAAQRIARRRPVNNGGRSWLGNALAPLTADVRYAVRSFAKRPGFSLTVITQLGLGIGATITILSVVDNVLLRQLPYPEADRLVVFGNPGHSLPLYTDWRKRTHSFSAMAAAWSDSRGFGVSGDGVPETVLGARVTCEFLQMFGATALRGRLLVNSDCGGTPPRAAVISHGLWQRRWGGSSVVGRTVTVEGSPVEIVGVLGPSFHPPDALVGSRVDLWLPLDQSSEVLQQRTVNILSVVARRKPGVSTESAQTDVNAVGAALAEEYPRTNRQRDGTPRAFPLIPLFEATVGEVDGLLYTLLGAAVMMLLISCANAAGLFLARGSSRTREMALRAALGAGRARMVAQLMTESLLLAVAGGVLAVALAFIAVNAFELLNPGGIPRATEVAIDARVLCLALGISLAAGLAFGIGPASVCSRLGADGILRSLESRTIGARRPLVMRRMLLVAEVATGLMLLVGAGLFMRSFAKLRGVDTGFDPENVLAMPLNLGARFSEEQRLQFTRDLLERIAAIPGVEAVGAGSTLPPYGEGKCCWFCPVRADPEDDDPALTMLHPVTPGYFSVLGASIVRGRGFTDADDDVRPTRTVINQTLARMLFGDADPLGRYILVAGERWLVVGVVNDIRHWGLHREGGPNAYVPHAMYGGPVTSLQLAVQSRIDRTMLSAALREAVLAIDPNLPIREITPMRSSISRSLARPRFLSVLVATFAAIAVLLAASGIYGFVSYSVRQRRRELGIRTALGAGRSDLMALVVRTALSLTLTGLALGLAGAFALSRVLEGLLYGVTATDPTSFAAAALLVGIASLAACYPPTREAAEAEPIETLRAE